MTTTRGQSRSVETASSERSVLYGRNLSQHLYLAVPMVVLFAAIWTNLETFRLGYQVERLQKQKEILVEKQRQLEMERARVSALARVESVARERLGLVTPGSEQVVYVQDGALPGRAPGNVPARARLPETQGPPAPVHTEEGF